MIKDPEQKVAINSEASQLLNNYEAYKSKQREESIGVDDYHEYIIPKFMNIFLKEQMSLKQRQILK